MLILKLEPIFKDILEPSLKISWLYQVVLAQVSKDGQLSYQIVV